MRAYKLQMKGYGRRHLNNNACIITQDIVKHKPNIINKLLRLLNENISVLYKA